MAWDYFKDGQRVGEMKILDLLDATQAKDTTTYLASCCKCGARAEMTHHQLLARVKKKVEACQKCKAHKGVPRVDSEIEGVRDLRGGFWPKLKGPMGPRWGLGNGSNSWFGTGASVAPI